MSIKQLLLAMATLMIVASTYAWPSLTQVVDWVVSWAMDWCLTLAAST
ncbi:hypothetical protein [Reinekea blandensis]|uniref:Ketol-acid reductoisomerase n=1 Tax=Reinekea blandensis MED297 TaxID=314283 RepID=A4BJI9_9GAMM|nr:hypothetical protein [Reinekea blandensis]EAR07693.1 ketol-acid reductoisomerase [Reinekea sp. MED297] [Reinekea blandensis MED297]